MNRKPRIIILLALALTLSPSFAGSFELTQKQITTQKNFQKACEQERGKQCIHACEKAKDKNCIAMCKSIMKNECRQARE